MIYNALKLFMEINPELFDECVQSYKRNKVAYVFMSIKQLPSNPNISLSERQALVTRYDNWQKMRAIAAKHTKDGKLPARLQEQSDYPPPPPPPVSESDFPDPSIELSHAALEADALDFQLQGTGFGNTEGAVLGLNGQDGYAEPTTGTGAVRA